MIGWATSRLSVIYTQLVNKVCPALFRVHMPPELSLVATSRRTLCSSMTTLPSSSIDVGKLLQLSGWGILGRQQTNTVNPDRKLQDSSRRWTTTTYFLKLGWPQKHHSPKLCLRNCSPVDFFPSMPSPSSRSHDYWLNHKVCHTKLFSATYTTRSSRIGSESRRYSSSQVLSRKQDGERGACGRQNSFWSQKEQPAF